MALWQFSLRLWSCCRAGGWRWRWLPSGHWPELRGWMISSPSWHSPAHWLSRLASCHPPVSSSPPACSPLRTAGSVSCTSHHITTANSSPAMTHLISSIFLIFALCLRLVKTSAAVAVPRTMMTTPTNTLVPALYTEPRLEAAAWRNLSLDAEHDTIKTVLTRADTYRHTSHPGP